MFKKFINSITMPKHIALSSLLIVVSVALISFILLIEVPLLSTVSDAGSLLGEEAGKIVGMVIGSFSALNEAGETIEDAKIDAARGEITASAIKSDFSTICILEVLSTDVDVHYTWEYGDPTSYAIAYVLKGTGVFYTDLTKADVVIKNDYIKVTLEEPSLKVYFDGLPEGLAKYTEPSISKDLLNWVNNLFQDSSAANAGYLKQRSEAIKNVKKHMFGYDGLLDKAKTSAENSIKTIIKSVYDMEVNVEFKGTGDVHEG